MTEKSKIILTNSYFYKYDSKQWKTRQPYPPLATLYAASVLRDNKYAVEFFDHCLADDNSLVMTAIQSGVAPVLVIYEDGFNYLTKMCLTTMRQQAFAMIHHAKQYHLTVIVSSSDATDHYSLYHEEGVDFIIHGEAELTLLELINQMDSQQNYANIQGISYRENGQLKRNPPRPVLTNLDILPIPAWDLIDFQAYQSVWSENSRQMLLNVVTTRGCPFKCNWCAKPIYGNRYNSRNAKAVVDELKYLVHTFGIHTFWFCDDIFGLKPGWVQEFREAIKEEELSIKFKIQSRVDLLLKDDTIDALIDSGLDIVWVGAESGSQKILDAMEKGTQVNQIFMATEKIKSKGARIGFFLQFGYPGENSNDIKKTLKMLLDLMPDDLGVSISYPLPGTKFYEKVKHQLKKKTNWTDSDDLDLLYKSTFSRKFYRKLHRYVHYRYRIKKGWLNLKHLIRSPDKIRQGQLREIGSMIFSLPPYIISLPWISKIR